MPDHLPWLADELEELDRAGLRRRRREVIPLPDGRCVVDGPGMLNFAGNDYLNLARDPRVVAAARTALEAGGGGASASALVTGRTPWLARLEARLAAFERQETAIVFPSGYAANVGTIAALARHGDVIFCDRLNHASLVDGCRLSSARLRVYRHDELDRLNRELSKAPTSGRRWIVTDAVFSMDGDLAPLLGLCDLAERHGAELIVDEAHATGVFGDQGRGACEALGVEGRVAVRVGTLSKALGSLGGFVAGPQTLVDWLFNSARTQMFSTALAPAACAAACAAIDIVEAEPERRLRLAEKAGRVRKCAGEAGLPLVRGAPGPILPVLLDDPERAVAAAAALQEDGFLVAAIRPPTVPRGTSRLRVSLNCDHKRVDVEALVKALARHARRAP